MKRLLFIFIFIFLVGALLSSVVFAGNYVYEGSIPPGVKSVRMFRVTKELPYIFFGLLPWGKELNIEEIIKENIEPTQIIANLTTVTSGDFGLCCLTCGGYMKKTITYIGEVYNKKDLNIE